MKSNRPIVSALGLSAVAALTIASFATAAPDTHKQSNLKGFELQNCELPKTAKVTESDAQIRESAQKGLNFLADKTVAWQEKHNCMGCHVQGVTGEALSVGIHHQYEVDDDKMKVVLTGLLDVSGGIRSEDGHAAPNGSLRPSARSYSGAAIARYDEWVKNDLSDDLLKAAHDLLPAQDQQGSIHQAYNAGVVARGPLQGTYQAIQTWQQAYARSADDRWLTAIASGERYIQSIVDGWYANPPTDVQALNYALLGLLEAGVGPDEQVAKDLKARILWLQNEDGGWGYGQTLPTNYSVQPKSTTADPKGSGQSSALTTGQALYALRALGMTDKDKVIKHGTDWLVEHQSEDGGWSHGGSEKGEAMWAVLGLVSTDVVTIDMAGLKSGQHVGRVHPLAVTTKDNSGAGVHKVEVFVDDLPVAGSCSDKVKYSLDARELKEGLHTVEVRATTKTGQQTSRRWIVYAGNTFLTNVGTRFENDATKISFRDIADSKMGHNVEIEVFSTVEKDGVSVKSKPVRKHSQKGNQGANSYVWDGKDAKGKALTSGEYVAVLKMKDANGKVRQTVEMPFVHDTLENQRRGWGDVAGKIDFAGDDVQGAVIDLVDEQGNVVQSVNSTKSGSYRFKNAKAKKKYKVRVRRQGFKAVEKEVRTEAAAEAPAAAAADFSLQAE